MTLGITLSTKFSVMLSVVMLDVIMLDVVMLSVVKPNVMLSVVTPQILDESSARQVPMI